MLLQWEVKWPLGWPLGGFPSPHGHTTVVLVRIKLLQGTLSTLTTIHAYMPGLLSVESVDRWCLASGNSKLVLLLESLMGLRSGLLAIFWRSLRLPVSLCLLTPSQFRVTGMELVLTVTTAQSP